MNHYHSNRTSSSLAGDLHSSLPPNMSNLLTPGDGCCPLCGIQVYKIIHPPAERSPTSNDTTTTTSSSTSPSSKKKKNGKWKQLRGLVLRHHQQQQGPKAIPISIQGKVANGQCLVCEETCDEQDNDEVYYIGEYNIYGERHGYGEIIWSNGHRYVGNFFNGMRDGKGTLFLNNDSEYKGDWELNRMSGTGTRKFANGDVYTGQYVEGKRTGQGKLFFANGDLYSGEWKDDTFHGLGRYYRAYDSTAFEGTYSFGKKEGKFKLQHASGKLDIVRFENDLCVGAGVRWSKDRSKTWLLAPSKKKTRGSKSEASASLCSLRTKKRIPVVEAVSIGYNCEHDPSMGEEFQLTTIPLEGITEQSEVPSASPVHDYRHASVNDINNEASASTSWLRVIGSSNTRRTDVVTATLL